MNLTKDELFFALQRSRQVFAKLLLDNNTVLYCLHEVKQFLPYGVQETTDWRMFSSVAVIADSKLLENVGRFTEMTELPPHTETNASLFNAKDSETKDICINGLRVRQIFGQALLKPCSVLVAIKDVAHHQNRTHLVLSFMFPAPYVNIELNAN